MFFPDFAIWLFISARVKKRHSFYIARPAIRRVVWLRCINSSWIRNVVFTRRSVFFALCIHIVRIRINYILVSASSDILFHPLKGKRKLLLARKIRFFTCIGVIFWQVIAKHEAILRLTSSLALPLFSIPSKNRLYISAKNEVLRILMPGALFQREKLLGYRPGLAHVQPFVTTKTSGKSRGLTSLDFAQLGPVRPSGPPYLHSVYSSKQYRPS